MEETTIPHMTVTIPSANYFVNLPLYWQCLPHSGIQQCHVFSHGKQYSCCAVLQKSFVPVSSFLRIISQTHPQSDTLHTTTPFILHFLYLVGKSKRINILSNLEMHKDMWTTLAFKWKRRLPTMDIISRPPLPVPVTTVSKHKYTI